MTQVMFRIKNPHKKAYVDVKNDFSQQYRKSLSDLYIDYIFLIMYSVMLVAFIREKGIVCRN